MKRTFKSATFWAAFGMSLVLVAILAGTGVLWAQSQQSVDNHTVFRYDRTNDRWVKTVMETVIPDNPDGTHPPGHHTIEIYIDEDNPVKEILIEEALIIYPSGSGEPLLEIKGHEPSASGNGTLNIGTLSFLNVDAEEMKIDADIMRVTLQNVVANDDELDLDLRVVNVVRTGRGAASSLLLGLNRVQRQDKFFTGEDIGVGSRGFTEREAGLRVDRIRIIGPDSGTGFVELITIKQSSVFGKIEVDDVEIQDLVLQQVVLDDSP